MFLQQLSINPLFFFATVITVVLSICIHELAHGVAAIRLGDRTPIETGHMTLNPAVHMGLFSILALLVAGISWGAMPIDPGRIRRGHRFGPAIVAVAGPLSNVALALLSLTALGLWYRFDGVLDQGTRAGNLQYLLWVFGTVNIGLAIFNMFPVPPLDGSAVLANFSDGYRSLIDRLGTSGGSTVAFVVVFMVAGRFIEPARMNVAHRWLELVSGHALELVRG